MQTDPRRVFVPIPKGKLAFVRNSVTMTDYPFPFVEVVKGGALFPKGCCVTVCDPCMKFPPPVGAEIGLAVGQ
jgi:hypothetical protein